MNEQESTCDSFSLKQSYQHVVRKLMQQITYMWSESIRALYYKILKFFNIKNQKANMVLTYKQFICKQICDIFLFLDVYYLFISKNVCHI